MPTTAVIPTQKYVQSKPKVDSSQDQSDPEFILYHPLFQLPKRKNFYFDPQVSTQVKCPKLMSIVNLEDLNHHINYHGSLSLMTKKSKTSNLVI